jgi:hypothetical protein
MVIMEKFNERKSTLKRLLVDIDDLKVNPLTDDFGDVKLKDEFEINDEIKKVIKMSKNDYLDLEYIFITTI